MAAQSGTEDDNTSVSSNEPDTDMETREARAMAAQLENMKQIERQQKSQSLSHGSGGINSHSPRSIPNIVPMTNNQINNQMSNQHYTVNVPSQVSPISPHNHNHTNQNINNINNINNQSHHNRNNSNPHQLQQAIQVQQNNQNPQMQQPRLSNSSVHSGSRSQPYNAQHPNQIQTFHPMHQQHPQQGNSSHNIYNNVTPNSYQMQNGGAPRQFFQQPQGQQHSPTRKQTGSRLSDAALSMPSLDENKDVAEVDLNQTDTLSAIWKEIKEIKNQLMQEQEKNEQLRHENNRLRSAVRTRNRKIKQLTGKKYHDKYDDNYSNNNNTNRSNTISVTPEPADNYIMGGSAGNMQSRNDNTPLIAPYANHRTASRNSIDSIGTDDTLQSQNTSISDWMIGLGNSLKAKKCNWF